MTATYDFIKAQTGAHLARALEEPYALNQMGQTGFTPTADGLVGLTEYSTEVVLRNRQIAASKDNAAVNPSGNRVVRVETEYDTVTLTVGAWEVACYYNDKMVADSIALGTDIPDEQVQSAFKVNRDIEDDFSFLGTGSGVTATDSFALSSRMTDLTTDYAEHFDALDTDAKVKAAMTEIAATINRPAEDTNGRYPATHFALPLKAYNGLAGAVRDGTTQSVLNWIRETWPGITIVPLTGLQNAGGTNAGRTVAYSTSNDVGRHLLMMPAQLTNLVTGSTYYEQAVLTRSAGFYWTTGKAAARRDNAS